MFAMYIICSCFILAQTTSHRNTCSELGSLVDQELLGSNHAQYCTDGKRLLGYFKIYHCCNLSYPSN